MEYRQLPSTLHERVPPHPRNREQSAEIFQGTCRTIMGSFTTATAYGLFTRDVVQSILYVPCGCMCTMYNYDDDNCIDHA